MNYKTKRRYKRKAKLFFSLAWGLTILWVLIITYGIYLVFTLQHLSNNNKEDVGFGVLFIIYIFPLILGLIFGMIGQYYVNKRIRYKVQIKEYRQRRFFTQVIDLLRIDNLNDAINIYEDLLTDRDLRKFVFPLLIKGLMNSTDEDQHDKGMKILNSVLENYNPEKIIF